MPDKGVVELTDQLVNSGPPIKTLGGHLRFGDNKVNNAAEDVILVGHVVVQRHDLEPELVRQLAHAQRLDPVLIGITHRCGEDPISGQW